MPLHFEGYIDARDLAERAAASATAFEKVTAVLHLGACSATTEQDLRFLLHNNLEYSKTMAEWAMGIGARFVYTSSGRPMARWKER